MPSVWKSVSPVEVEELRLIDQPRAVVICARGLELTLTRLEPLSEVGAFLDACEIQIHDVNQETGAQLEFGRFRVEAWDEDHVISSFRCDSFDVGLEAPSAAPNTDAVAGPSLSLLVLRCPKLEASKRFFEALGLAWRQEKHGSGPSHWSSRLGDVILELYPGESAASSVRLGLRVPNLDAILQSIPDAQQAILEHHSDRGFAVVRAPDGTKIELSQLA
jgi:lactoylglutathione lyase